MENQNTTSKVKEFAKKLGSYLLIIVMLVIGYHIGRVSTNLFKPSKAKIAPEIKSISEVSIAINESNNILIINRKDGSYEMFSDSVGMTIFRIYAGRIKNGVSANN
jgi:hypothetical protein